MSNKKIITGRQENGVWGETYPKTVSGNVYMDEYVKAAQAEAVLPTDTVNQAIGKLEKAVEQGGGNKGAYAIVVLTQSETVLEKGTRLLPYNAAPVNEQHISMPGDGDYFVVPEGYNMARWSGSIDVAGNFNAVYLKPWKNEADLGDIWPSGKLLGMGDTSYSLNCPATVAPVQAGDRIGLLMENVSPEGIPALTLEGGKVVIELFNV